MRKVFFWFHLTIGLAAGLVILIMSATGVLLTYEKQMIQWADRRAAAIEPAGSPMPVSQLLQAAAKEKGANPGGITIRNHPSAPAEVAFGQGREAANLLVNPYTGASAGEGATDLRKFFRATTLWHRWLGSQEGARGWQKQVTGASNAIFVILGFTGLYMWWPRKWTPAIRRTAFVPQMALSGKARDFNWHNAMGFWMSIPIIVVAGTALVMSYPSANNLVYRVAGEEPPAGRGGPAPAGERRGGTERPSEGRPVRGERQGVNTENLDAMFAKAAATNPEWKSISLRFAGPRVNVQVDGGWGGQPQLRETLVFSRAGELVEREGFYSQTPGRRARSWMRFLHTGEALGLTGQTIAGLASLVGVILVWTGVSLSLRRFTAWRRRGTRVEIEVPVMPLKEEKKLTTV